jgi:hypothetical protein
MVPFLSAVAGSAASAGVTYGVLRTQIADLKDRMKTVELNQTVIATAVAANANRISVVETQSDADFSTLRRIESLHDQGIRRLEASQEKGREETRQELRDLRQSVDAIKGGK